MNAFEFGHAVGHALTVKTAAGFAMPGRRSPLTLGVAAGQQAAKPAPVPARPQAYKPFSGGPPAEVPANPNLSAPSVGPTEARMRMAPAYRGSPAGQQELTNTARQYEQQQNMLQARQPAGALAPK